MEKRLEALAPLALDALEYDLLLGTGRDRREAAKLLLSMDGWSANDRRIQGAAPAAPVTVVVQALPWAREPARVVAVDAAPAALPEGAEKKE